MNGRKPLGAGIARAGFGRWFSHVPKFLINLANEEKERKEEREEI